MSNQRFFYCKLVSFSLPRDPSLLTITENALISNESYCKATKEWYSGTIRTVMTSHTIADVFIYTLKGANLMPHITKNQFQR